MERRIGRIVRWLDRCAKACSAGSWQSALMDMECAKAELEGVRQDLWARAEGNPAGSRVVRRTGRAVTAAALGLALVMSVAGPLAAPPSGRGERATVLAESASSLEWVSTDEKALLTALRHSLSDANLARLSVEEEAPRPRGEAPAPVAKPRTGAVRVREEGPEVQTPSHGSGEFDTIINLVQIGQRALRDRESAIRFDAP